MSALMRGERANSAIGCCALGGIRRLAGGASNALMRCGENRRCGWPARRYIELGGGLVNRRLRAAGITRGYQPFRD